MMRQSRWVLGLSLMVVLALLGLSSCQSCSKKSVFTASGRPLDMVVVLPAAYDSPELRDSIRVAFGQPVTILPQPEPILDLMFTLDTGFTSMFRSIRNILYVSIDPTMYTRPSVTISRDDFAVGQILIHAKADSLDSFYTLLRVRAGELSQRVYMEEILRHGFNRMSTYSSAYAQLVEDSVAGGFTINAPVELSYYFSGENFVWGSNMQQKSRMDMVVYSFPYRDADTFTVEYLVQKRDSVMKLNILGQYEDSYMTTEKRVGPFMRTLKFQDRVRVELRGLWAMENDMMGGPFVMHAMLSEDNTQVVVAEAFVYNPGDKKRNLMLYDEASLYSLRPIGESFSPFSTIDKE